MLTLRPCYHSLDVAGLAEGRPSILVGDFILVRRQGMHDDPWYEGCVHKVLEASVSLRFDSEFSTYRGTKFDVRFKLNRLSLRRMHQSLVTSFNPTRILFPRHEHISTATRMSFDQLNCITPVNRLIREDKEQLETVGAILHQPRGSVPFVVFGP